MRRRLDALIVFLLVVCLCACSQQGAHAKPATANSGAPKSAVVSGLHVPAGFHIQFYARGLDGPRMMTFAPNGDLLVAETDAGRVVAIPHAMASPEEVASNLTLPHGLTMRASTLYIATWSGITRMQYPRGRLWTEVAGFPHNDDHNRRGLTLGPDGDLYVSIGASCNVCDDVPPLATLDKVLPGGALVRYASGLRNAEGLAFDAQRTLWATVDQRDNIGPTQAVTDDLPPDELVQVKSGDDFGWPSCYPDPHKPKRDPNPEYPGADCSRFKAAALNFRAHTTPIGIAFYEKRMFPPKYRGAAFVALHGSWDRRVPDGDKVVYVTFAGGKPTGYANFITGWLVSGRFTGRPTDVAVARDGSLFVSDDAGGNVYRITYAP